MIRETKPVTKEEVMAMPVVERAKRLADTYAILSARSRDVDEKDMYYVFSATLLELLEVFEDDGK